MTGDDVQATASKQIVGKNVRDTWRIRGKRPVTKDPSYKEATLGLC